MKTINFNNHKFQISRDGILFWLDKQIAIISDLHLEKGSSFGPSGQFLPPYDSEETLTKLLSTINKYNITKVILLGDTFHDKNAFSSQSIFPNTRHRQNCSRIKIQGYVSMSHRSETAPAAPESKK